MRARWSLLLVLLLAVPSAAAEFGRDDAHGYPIAVDGRSTYPGGLLPTGALPEGPLNQVGPFTLYPYYPVLTAEVRRLATDHPDLVRLTSIGTSTLGLELWMLEIANFDDPEMIPLEEREVVWVDGGTHSNEYSGVWFAAHLASFLVDQYGTNETARWIVDHRHTWIMPLVNPDGSHAFGRLNARAVNVNRNYPVDWGALSEDAVVNNPGPSPASEIETRANIEAFNMTRPDLYVSVHCCGNLWLYPYGVEGMDPPDQQTFARICDEAFASVREDCGPIWSTIYPASGSSVDTVYEYTGAAGFGYEMSGRNALALWGQPFSAGGVQTEETESWTGILHGMLNVHRYGAHPAIVSASMVDGALRVRITNDGYGNLTNASLGSVPILDLLPGQTTHVTLPGPLREGENSFTLRYQKRVMAAPMGEREVVFTLAQGAQGLEVAGVDGEEVEPLSAAAAPVPAAGLSAVLAAIVGVFLVRRRFG